MALQGTSRSTHVVVGFFNDSNPYYCFNFQDDEEQKTKTDSPHTESPPIIIEEVPADVSRQTDDESFHFDDNNSQKCK